MVSSLILAGSGLEPFFVKTCGREIVVSRGSRYRERHEHGHYATRNATFLSPAGRANLRIAFRREYEVLAALEAGPGRVALA